MKTKRKKIFIGLLVLAFLCCFAFAGAAISMASNSTAEFVLNGTIEAVYKHNSSVELPSGSFNYDGKTYSAETVVYYPNGYGYAKNNVTLSVHGKYVVQYRAEINGKLETAEYEFLTEKKQFEFNTAASSASYGIDDTFWNTSAKKPGLYAKIAKGDVFTYNDPVNIKELDGETFVEFHLLPDVIGASDAGGMHITLTDAGDENNYIDWYCSLGSGAQGYRPNKARATGQTYVGIEYWKNQTVHIGNIYGHYILWAPGGNVETMTTTQQQLYYNVQENSLWNTVGHDQGRICDFDASYQAEPWAGFKSDYAYLSVYAEDYNGETFNILFTKIGHADLSKTRFVDDKGPDIELNAGSLDVENLPNAIVGKSYKLPGAFATDTFATGAIRVSRRVFCGYSRETGIYTSKCNSYSYEYDTKGGRFTPDEAGKYSIVYGATDYVGNYTEKVVTVNAVAETIDNIEFDLSGEYKTEQNAYNKTELANAENIRGAVGNIETVYKVICEDEYYDVKGNIVTGYSFIPEKQGEYTVSITVRDFVGNDKTVNYTVNVVLSGDPAFDQDVALPLYFIRGEEYSLPALTAKDVNNGGAEVKSTVTVIDGLGKRSYNGGKITFIPDANGKAVIRYGAGENFKDYSVPVISVKNGEDLDLTKYFIVSEGAIEVKGEQLGVLFTSRNTDGAATFVKPLLQNALNVTLRTDAANNGFEFVTFKLQDSLDPTQAVKVSVRKTKAGSNAEIWINGEKTSASVTNPFYQSGNFNLIYDYKNFRVSDGNSAGVVLTKTVLGETFTGFSSGLVYVTIGMEGVKTRANLYVNNINGQKINGDIISDTVRPETYLSDSYSEKIISAGTVVNVYSMAVGDVLSNITLATVSVAFKNSPVVGSDGRVLYNLPVTENYSFTATEFGRYTISYQVKDSAGKPSNQAFYIDCVDMTKPVIKPVAGIPAEGKLGNVFVIPATTAVDDIDGEVKVTMFVVYPDLTVRTMTDVKHFTFIQTGTYVIRYLAFDASGNKASLEYEINVRG